MDIVNILNQYNIHYVTEGSNVADGNINVRCPFCGQSDPSEHMGIHLQTGAWGCWRHATHRGRRLEHLLVPLLRITQAIAVKLLDNVPIIQSGHLAKEMERLLSSKKAMKPQPKEIEFPKEFQPLQDTRGARHYLQYLLRRKFNEEDVLKVAATYNLHYATKGDWKGRIIIPIMDEGTTVRGWIARAIGRATRKYLFHPSGPQAKGYIYNLPIISGDSNPDVFLITEGPFDAMKVDYYGWMAGGVTCTFGVVPTNTQVAQLNDIGERFERTVICYDADAQDKAEMLAERIPSLRPHIVEPPKGAQDLGELSPNDAEQFITQLVPKQSEQRPISG